MKVDELKGLDDEKKVYTEMKKFYVNTVDRKTRMKNGLGEGITQGKKFVSLISRASNGQLRLYESGLAMAREQIKSFRTLAGFALRNGIVGVVLMAISLICNASFYMMPFDPTGTMAAIYLTSQVAEYTLIFIASPILDMPPIILRTKEDIMNAAKNLMRVQFSGKNAGKVDEKDNFLSKMMKYYDVMYEIKTKAEYSFSVILKNETSSSSNIIKNDEYKTFREKFDKATKSVTESLEYVKIYKEYPEFREKLTEEDKKTLARYYLAQYSSDNGITLFRAITQIFIANDESPFRKYLNYRKIRNKEYILNEVTKLQLLLKIYFLEYTQKTQIQIKPTDIEIKYLITFYNKLYNESRTMKSMIRGSPENLELKYTELDSDVRKEIDKNIIQLTTQPQSSINDFIVMQIKKSMQTRNSEIKDPSYTYRGDCDSKTGMYLRHKQSDADACKLQDKIKKRITQYINDAKSYKPNHPENPPRFTNIPHYRLFMIFMQHYAKRAYVESGVGKDFLKTYTNQLQSIDNMDTINTTLVQFFKDYMKARYLGNDYKLKLINKTNGTVVNNIEEVVDTKLTDITNKVTIQPKIDEDEIGDIEKQILEEYDLTSGRTG